MSDKDSSEIQRADEGLGLERIDPDGNGILLLEGQHTARFLVSSKILSMASPVFTKLFYSGFYEGIQMANSSCPTISLHGDDPVAMRIIIRALHYQEPEQDGSMDAEAFASLAIHCDKYDCVKALKPWVIKWFSDLQYITTAEEYGYLLLAAHLFRSPEQFSRLSVKAQTQLSSKFLAKWDRMDTMELLPSGVQSDLANRIQVILDQIHTELQSVEGRLRDNQAGYKMQGLVCMRCGRTHPDTARMCHACNNSNLIEKYCTSDCRIAEYFAGLRKTSLWPSLEPFQCCSAGEIANFVSQTKLLLRHSCQAKSCPLELELDMLVRRITGIISKVQGLPLYPLHRTSLSDRAT